MKRLPGGVPDGVLAVAGGQWTRRRNSGISSGSSPGSWPLTGPMVCTITLGPIPPVNSARRENPGLGNPARPLQQRLDTAFLDRVAIAVKRIA